MTLMLWNQKGLEKQERNGLCLLLLVFSFYFHTYAYSQLISQALTKDMITYNKQSNFIKQFKISQYEIPKNGTLKSEHKKMEAYGKIAANQIQNGSVSWIQAGLWYMTIAFNDLDNNTKDAYFYTDFTMVNPAGNTPPDKVRTIPLIGASKTIRTIVDVNCPPSMTPSFTYKNVEIQVGDVLLSIPGTFSSR